MGRLDVAQLLEPISPDQPCGENLEYDADFGEMERAAQPVAAQQIGESVVEGQEPDWRAVGQMAEALCQRTKDLRVAVLLTRALVRTDGLGGLRESLAVIRGLIEQYWETVHPQLDPEDDNDPAIRVNTLVALCDHDACLRAVLEAPLLASSMLGPLAYRDYLVTTNELPPRQDEQPREMSDIEAVLMNCEPDDLLQQAQTVREAAEDVRAIEEAVTREVGAGRAASFEPLESLLSRMQRLLDDYVERRGIGQAAEEPAAEETVGDSSFDDMLASMGEETSQEEPPPPPPAFDEVRSRDDVIRLLDKICDYYQEHEPSSPVPLLLRRAKRVATMTFLELLRELAPGGLEQAESIGGGADAGA